MRRREIDLLSVIAVMRSDLVTQYIVTCPRSDDGPLSLPGKAYQESLDIYSFGFPTFCLPADRRTLSLAG